MGNLFSTHAGSDRRDGQRKRKRSGDDSAADDSGSSLGLLNTPKRFTFLFKSFLFVYFSHSFILQIAEKLSERQEFIVPTYKFTHISFTHQNIRFPHEIMYILIRQSVIMELSSCNVNI